MRLSGEMSQEIERKNKCKKAKYKIMHKRKPYLFLSFGRLYSLIILSSSRQSLLHPRWYGNFSDVILVHKYKDVYMRPACTVCSVHPRYRCDKVQMNLIWEPTMDIMLTALHPSHRNGIKIMGHMCMLIRMRIPIDAWTDMNRDNALSKIRIQ